MKNNLILFLLIFSVSANAQYYYTDILGTNEMSTRMETYRQNKVKSVTATGTDERGMKSTDFNEWQEVRENGKALKITTRNGYNKTILYYRFNDAGKLVSLIDSSLDVQSVSNYNYDASGRLLSIENTTRDSSLSYSESEKHIWTYDANGKPKQVWRILNGSDSLEVRFTIDEDGNVADEQVFKRGVGVDPVLYYYDDKNRLSDVVRFNKKLNKLLPDFMFEYDEQDRMIQKITTISSFNMGYLIWRYIYDNKGLKTKEALFDKEKQLTGRIDYTYSFN